MECHVYRNRCIQTTALQRSAMSIENWVFRNDDRIWHRDATEMMYTVAVILRQILLY